VTSVYSRHLRRHGSFDTGPSIILYIGQSIILYTVPSMLFVRFTGPSMFIAMSMSIVLQSSVRSRGSGLGTGAVSSLA